MIAWALLGVVALQGEPEVLLARYAPTGLEGAAATTVRAALTDRVTAAGARLVDPSETIDDSCLAAPACMGTVVEGRAAALAVVAVRIGPIVQVTSTLYRPDGTSAKSADVTVTLDEIGGGMSLLGAELDAELAALVAAAPREPAPSAEAPPDAASTASPTTTTGPGPLPLTLFAVGGTALVLGTAVFLVAAVTASTQAGVLSSPTTTTAEKDTAILLGRVAIFALPIGGLVAVGGAGVVASGLMVE